MKKLFLTFAAACMMLAVSAQPQGGQMQMPEGFQKMMESMQKITTERNEALKKIMVGEQVAKFDAWVQQQAQMMGRGMGQRPQGAPQGAPQGQRPQGAPQGGFQGAPQGAPQGGFQGAPQGQRPQGAPQGGMRMNSEAMIQFQVEALNTAVTLTDDQKKQATTIFQDAAKKQQELMAQMRPQGAPQQQ